ncbi:MAG: ribokinase [Balneolales bacterium]
MNEDDSIVVIGSSNTDMVILTSHFPSPGETILGGEFLMNAGGKGANQAVAAARSGGRVTFVGKVGKDLFGKEAIRNIEHEGIDVSPVATDMYTASGIAQITVVKNGENSIVVAPGANMILSEADIDNANRQIKEAAILLMQLEVPLKTVVYAAKSGYKRGKKVILNPAPAAVLPDELFACLYMITPNETEAERLTGVAVTNEKSAAEAAGILKARGVEIVIITMGAKGVYVCSDEQKGMVAAPVVEAVDTTAAGDCFNGALAAGLARGIGLDEAVRYAIQAASISVTRIGAQASMPYRKETESLLV